MRKLFSWFVMVMFLIVSATCLFSKVTVGEAIFETVETPHPYPGKTVWEHVFNYPNAGYIAIHFSTFDLAPGDYVEISSPDGRFSSSYREKGKVVRGGAAVLSEFWATHIPGDTAIVRLHSKNRNGGWGFEIDQWVRGYDRGYIDAVLSGLEEEAQGEAICSSDDKEWAPCYEGTLMYEKAWAVCRLLIAGTSACTGWLLGSDGHIMTNNHCIDTQYEADNTDYEFMAEGSTCDTDCSGWMACPGIVEASSGTLIKQDYNLDYALILLPVNLTSTYGYLQFRDMLPTVGERIYIPQHPGAYGKQLAVFSDVDGLYAKIYSTNEYPCFGGPGDIGYYADTAGGSSGSPVIAYNDHLVVALDHCANCPNRGVPVTEIISHLGPYLPNSAIGYPGFLLPPSNVHGVLKGRKVELSWTDNSDFEQGFRIYRGLDPVYLSLIAIVGPNTTSYTDTGVHPKNTYYYKVCAYTSSGESCANVISVSKK
ncbi:MAG: hypothetical protein GTO45_19000 [Candidatus Aminicenantes bacterium]|nr:hypothetical protein [Candidatus Aminicenantes bacterium]NIM80876.1 hypothetical protein [Candidatus Aminicenantes bacterium]NIN20260.1 hypothetical protein [Candidatus Aminicenantes bacterium]NIN44039.1 hypothetical protein [Candidatus Aminicenantes bacterium]NIN86849.1 hypothetical protein [Candidatus Aminicenantes bacterium]